MTGPMTNPTAREWAVLIYLLLSFTSASNAEEAIIAGSAANGDVTLLTSFEVAADSKQAFETQAKAAAQRSIEKNSDAYILYDEFTDSKDTARYFTVHFPHDLDELTEPNSANFEVIASLGAHRVHSELTRQVPDWCSTIAMDPYLLEYAFVEYLWLEPGSLDRAGALLAQRGQLLRDVYGTSSAGNAATEGFIAMVAAPQIMLVLFSSESDRQDAHRLLEADIEEYDRLAEWRSIHEQLETLVTERRYRSGLFRPDLIVE